MVVDSYATKQPRQFPKMNVGDAMNMKRFAGIGIAQVPGLSRLSSEEKKGG